MTQDDPILLCTSCADQWPIQDDIWPSRRWNRDRTEHVDLAVAPRGTCAICGTSIPCDERCRAFRWHKCDGEYRGNSTCDRPETYAYYNDEDCPEYGQFTEEDPHG